MYKKIDKNDVDYLLSFIPQERLLVGAELGCV